MRSILADLLTMTGNVTIKVIGNMLNSLRDNCENSVARMQLATRQPASASRGQAGFTLIELMVSLIVGSILIAMAFSLYATLSVAYRAQSEVSELQQALRAAKMHITRQVRAAGHLIPNGFTINDNGTDTVIPALTITNDAVPADADFSPDKIRLFYADVSAIAVVQVNTTPADRLSAHVDDIDAFRVGDLALIVNPKTSDEINGNIIANYDACLVRITALDDASPDVIHFDNSGAPINSSTNSHCSLALDPNRKPMIYRFVGRSYRIDPEPTRRGQGILQMSPSGELIANDWQDMGIGFTNLQVAMRYFEDGSLVDLDNDGDSIRNWYSGSVAAPVSSIPIAMTLSLELRTTHELDLTATSATPTLTISTANIDHNRIGDWDAVQLAGVDDNARPEQYRGNRIYRWSTSTVDIRNLGVGR